VAKFNILTRQQVLINTDPQRRCYNGCHFSSELVWTNWVVLEYGVEKERCQRRVEFWKELNDIAVAGRGEGARREFKLEPTVSE
jgi:hypothetical protein